MVKVTLDMNTFKALASDTRLDILRALDGKKMGWNGWGFLKLTPEQRAAEA